MESNQIYSAQGSQLHHDDGSESSQGKTEAQFDRSFPIEWNSIEMKKKWGSEAQEMVAGLLCEKSVRRWDAQKLLSCSFLDGGKEKIDEDTSTH